MLGILGAMPEEITMLRSVMESVSTHTHLGRDFFQGQLYGHPVVLVQGGIGKVRASITATTLVCQFPVQGIVFTGVAAGLRPDLQMGDVILAHRAIEHDFGMGRDQGFSLGLDFLPGEEAQVLEVNPALFEVATQVSHQATLDPLATHTPQIYPGLVTSGDTFVAGEQIRQQIYSRTQADVVEMEGVAVIRVAQDAGIPCLLVRSVSDTGDSSDFLDFFHHVAHNSAELVRVLLQSLP